jgi:glycerol-3-phosphate acyltransferase PlsY
LDSSLVFRPGLLYVARCIQFGTLFNQVCILQFNTREHGFPVFILVIFNVDNHAYRVFAVVVALMVILTHQKNINRILKGNESKVPILKHRDRRRQRRKEMNSDD